MKLSERLKIARKRAKLSQTEVSKLINLSNKTLSGYENDVSIPDIITLNNLSKIYNTTLDYLIGNNDNIVKEDEPSYKYINVYKEINDRQYQSQDNIINTIKYFTDEDKDHLALIIRNNKMYPNYLVGDTAIIEINNTLEVNKDILFIPQNSNAEILKCTTINNDEVIFTPMNTNYSPVTYNIKDLDIIGKVKEIRRELI
ncbi:helix-turn-helix domain-containing protein [Helcococcus kunzii]|uniref:helix-turn-helix domain-containing protein n=1 Tax=Helcococcus kunzii TaxID=40091 RepID=UPI0024AE2FAB|nr:helix-turn-helix domain-containing protein [Helcococcus kunzii]